MKIVVAPDSFKECLDAGAVAAAIAEGIYSVFPGAEVRPTGEKEWLES